MRVIKCSFASGDDGIEVRDYDNVDSSINVELQQLYNSCPHIAVIDCGQFGDDAAEATDKMLHASNFELIVFDNGSDSYILGMLPCKGENE